MVGPHGCFSIESKIERPSAKLIPNYIYNISSS